MRSQGSVACEPCTDPGTVVNTAQTACVSCRGGKWASKFRNECMECPKQGVTRCEGGYVEPEDGFWAPAAVDDTGRERAWSERVADSSLFNATTDVFACLAPGNTSCQAIDVIGIGNATPATAFNCSEGHRGVLCAACVSPELLAVYARES